MLKWLLSGWHGLIVDMINGVIQFIFSIISSVEITPFHPTQLPGFSALLLAVQSIASTLLILTYFKEGFMNELDSLTDNGVHPLSTFKNMVIAGVLIWISPYIVTDIVLPLSSYVEAMITDTGSIGGLPQLSTTLSNALTLDPNKGLIASVFTNISILTGFWPGVIFVLAILILVIIVGVSSAKRWFEIFVLLLIGPILAVSKVSYSGLWDQWLRLFLTAAFSQVVQLFSITLSFNILLNPTYLNAVNGTSVSGGAFIFLGIGAAFFAATGPSYLRNLLMGPSGGAGFNAVKGLASNAFSAIPR